MKKSIVITSVILVFLSVSNPADAYFVYKKTWNAETAKERIAYLEYVYGTTIQLDPAQMKRAEASPAVLDSVAFQLEVAFRPVILLTSNSINIGRKKPAIVGEFEKSAAIEEIECKYGVDIYLMDNLAQTALLDDQQWMSTLESAAEYAKFVTKAEGGHTIVKGTRIVADQSGKK